MGTTTKVIILSTLYLALVIISQWSTFSISYPLSEYEWRYSQSQYVLGDNRTAVMGDGDIYTYAGIRYIQGEDPTKINFEHPPLIKYLYGLSYLLTGKPNWVLIPLYYIAVFSFWYLASKTLKTVWARWLSLILFLGHSAIYTSIPQTMLDFPMTSFLLLTLALFISYLQSASYKKIIGFSLVAGLLLLTKYPFPLLLSLVVLLNLSLYLSKMPIKQIVLSIAVTAGTYLLGYFGYFVHNSSLLDFIRFEWWRLNWFSGKTDSPKGMIWQTIFLGRYPKWWDKSGGFIFLPHWNLLWPISTLLFALSWTGKKIINNPLFAYQTWIVVSLAAYSFGAAEDRFLIPLIPGFAIFGSSYVEKLLTPGKNGIISK